MRRTILLAGVFAALVGGAGVAGAAPGGTVQPLTLDPDSGPAGSTFEASGENCRDPFAKGTIGNVEVEVDAPGAEPPSATIPTEDIEEDGSWSIELTVPEDAEADDEIEVTARCQRTEPDALQNFRAGGFLWTYGPETFTVTGEDTPPSSDPPATPTSEPPDTLPDATPAPAVVARPTFTG